MTRSRLRTAAVAGSLAVSLSLAAGPAVFAQDAPEAPLEGVLAAIEEGRLTDATAFFCSELQDQALGGLGQLDMLAGMDLGLDFELLLGAISVDIGDVVLEVSDQTEEAATVRFQAAVETGVNEEGVAAVIASMMSTEEAPMDPSAVEAMLPLFLPDIESELARSLVIDEMVDVVLEDGAWKVCSNLDSLVAAFGGAMGQQGDAEMSDEMSDDEMPDETPAEDDSE